MANPLDIISEGINTGDWKKVVQGYNRMSGEKLKAPKAVVGTLEVTDLPNLREAEALAVKIQQVVQGNAMGNLVRLADKLLKALSNGEPGTQLKGCVTELENDDEEEEVNHIHTVLLDDDGTGTVEEQASSARAVSRGEKTVPDFGHVHEGTPEQDEKPGLGRLCRTEPFKPGMKNNFVDDGKEACGDTKIDKLLTKGMRMSERRHALTYIDVVCCKCEKTFKVDSKLAPRAVNAGATKDDRMSFVCDNCRKRSI